MLSLFVVDMQSHMQKTRAFHRLNDDIPQDVKDRRHKELVATFRRQSLELNMDQIGNKQLVLVEGVSNNIKFESALNLIVAVVKL